MLANATNNGVQREQFFAELMRSHVKSSNVNASNRQQQQQEPQQQVVVVVDDDITSGNRDCIHEVILADKDTDANYKSTIGQCEEGSQQSSNETGIEKKQTSDGPPGKNPSASRMEKLEGPFPYAGIGAAILGSIFSSSSMLCVKLLPDDLVGYTEKTKALFFRGLILSLCSCIAMLAQDITFVIKRDDILVNLLRSFFGFIGAYGVYVSLNYISMGECTALVFSSPIWTSLLSHLILKESLNLMVLFALPISFLGILLIAHPTVIIPMEYITGSVNESSIELANDTQLLIDAGRYTYGHDQQPIMEYNITSSYHNLTQSTSLVEPNVTDNLEHRWPGLLVSIITSFMMAFVYITLKFRKSTPIQTTTFWLGVFTMLMTTIIMCFIGFGEMPATYYEWLLLLGNGITSWIGQNLVQWALMREDASVLSIIRTSEVALTFTFSALFLEEQILWTSVVGATLIGLVVVSIVLNNWIRDMLTASGSK